MYIELYVVGSMQEHTRAHAQNGQRLRGRGLDVSELWRPERADAGEASESSRMRAVVYLKIGTRQTQMPHIAQTNNYTFHNLKSCT